MLDKYITPRSIARLAIVIAVVGIGVEVLTLFHLNYSYRSVISTLFALVELSFFPLDAIYSFGFNLLNLLFYLLLLVGGISYMRSDFVNVRLIRFVFSITLFAVVFATLFSIVEKVPGLFAEQDPYASASTTGATLRTVFTVVLNSAWAYVLYHILKELGKTKTVKNDQRTYGEVSVLVLDSSSTGQRLLHWLIDLFVMLLILFPIIKAFFYTISIDEETATIVMPLFFILLRVLYFLPFEFAFGSTPAKFLTESRVVTENGDAPSFSRLLGRTFSRFVPLEPLSFLWNGRWHDQWSATDVVREQPYDLSS